MLGQGARSRVQSSGTQLFELTARVWNSVREKMISPRLFLMVLVTVVALLSLWFQMETDLVYSSEVKRRSSNSMFYGLYSQRPSLRNDEFFRMPPSEDELEAIFKFDPDYEQIGHIDPIWSCLDYAKRPRERQRKLVFLHVPSAGGASFRALFRGYAYLCHAALASVGRCVDLGREYLEGEENWMNALGSRRSGQGCTLSWAENRTGHSLTESFARISTAFLEQNEIDILSGELPLGCDESWMNKTGHKVDVQNVVLLRDPVTRYISEFMFEHRYANLTVLDAVQLIRQRIQNETMMRKYHSVYSNHLISPEQKSWMAFEHIPWSPERKVNLSLSNLVEKQIVVGIMERMSQSLVLLQYLIDNERQVSYLFRYFTKPDKMADVLRDQNQVKAILRNLERDPLLMTQMKEILKYEQQIYDWGIKIHEAQLSRVMALGWPSAVEGDVLNVTDVLPPECRNSSTLC
jgi:Sulfotransferase family